MSLAIKESRGTEGFLIIPFLLGVAKLLAPVVLPTLAAAAVSAITGGPAAPPTYAVPPTVESGAEEEEEEEIE